MGFDIDAARAYIETVRWQFARTMPDWPHEYTVKAWRPDLSADFVAFCQLIADEGFVEPWPPAPAHPIYHNHYLVIGDHKYWAMGPHGDLDPLHEMTVINRAGASLAPSHAEVSARPPSATPVDSDRRRQREV